MPRTAGMRKDRHALAREVPSCTSMIEMHMGDKERTEVVRGDPNSSKLFDQPLERDRTATLDEHRSTRTVNHKRERSLGKAEVQGVERGDRKRAHHHKVVRPFVPIASVSRIDRKLVRGDSSMLMSFSRRSWFVQPVLATCPRTRS